MGRSRVEFERDVYDRREETRARSRGPPVREYEEDDIRIVEERGPDPNRQPYFMRENRGPAESAGQLVIRSRDFDERRGRDNSPPEEMRTREMRIVRARSEAPEPPSARTRMVEADRYRERDHSQVRARYVERDSSESPPRVRTTRIVERRERSISRSPSRERIRIVEKRVAPAPAPAPQPPPPPKEINEPTIRRKVITDYVAFDHGVIPVAPPPPPPPPPRTERKETEIDVYTRRGETEVDIRRSRSQTRTRSRSQERGQLVPVRRNEFRELVVRSDDRERLVVDFEESKKRRARSAAPPSLDIDDEAAYITSRIDARGRMGEAFNGITKDWTIVDVPPGTERVLMEGAGGASAEVQWQKYSGVRRAKFVNPDEPEPQPQPQPQPQPKRSKSRDRLSVQIFDKMGKEEIDIIEDRRIAVRQSQPPPPKRSEMWTEITKDLVIREAVEELGYEFEETDHFYYVMQYLRYEDVQQLVQLSDGIKRARKQRAREVEWEVDIRSSDYQRSERPRRHHRRRSVDRFEVDTEVTYEHRRH